MNEPLLTGAIGDPRSEEAKLLDYKVEEVAGSFPLKWVEKKEWKTYPVKRQYFTLECVGQSLAKHLAIHEERENGKYIDLSSGFIYDHRINWRWNDVGRLYGNRSESRFLLTR